MKIKYQVHEDNLQFAFEINVSYYTDIIKKYDIEEIAQLAADDYFNNHDGWEDKWPIDFYVYNENNSLLGMCKVIMETEPCFYATLKE